MVKLALILGTIYGLSGVILGAFGAHFLKGTLNEYQLTTFRTGVSYQMYHALLLLVLGILPDKFHSPLLTATIITIGLGTLFFSISLYLLSATTLRLGFLTPIGGTLLIAGWVVLLITVLKYG